MNADVTRDRGGPATNALQLARNRALHRELFTRRSAARHAFVVQPTAKPIWETGDYTTSDRPVADFVPGVSNDECGVMSPEMFETFCLPELVELSGQFGGLGMHCCANAQHQFELFRRIPNFYAFNRVPTGVGWEKDNALSVLGGADGPVMVPGWCSKEDVATLLRQAPPGTRFIFNSCGVDDPAVGREWLDAVRADAAAPLCSSRGGVS
jgi:hypothetical protein